MVRIRRFVTPVRLRLRPDATRGGGYTPSIKRQSVNTSVKPRDFAMYKRQIMCQEVSAECQILAPSAVSGRESLCEFVRVLGGLEKSLIAAVAGRVVILSCG